MSENKNNLDLFKTLFLVKGILTLCFSLFFLAYASIGATFMKLAVFPTQEEQLPFDPSIIFIIIGSIGFVFTITLGILTLLTSKFIRLRKKYNYIFVLAILNCFTGILGILLGIFTIIELNKPEVKELFGKK